MFNNSLYLLAYGNIYSNKGAMTPGACDETADGMSEAKIDEIIDRLRHERYRFAPVRRVYIPKKNGKLRPLGLPSWSDKLVSEVVRLLLEAYYEPQFSDRSHGFRKGRGCHTALRDVQNTWTGTVWFVEGDISDCFGKIDHEILLKILAEKIHDNRFLRLIRNMLKAGYMEDWEYHDTLSGTPQGGVVSPLLSNIYLDKLDKYIERELIPQHTRGTRRKVNPQYRELAVRRRAARQDGDREQARELGKQMRTLPYGDPMDPGYRRLFYIRYADDHLLGLIGPKAEAEEIKTKLAGFLGYQIAVQHSSTRITNGRRSVNGRIALRVPRDAVTAQCARYRRRGKPWHRSILQNLPDYDIVQAYGAEYRGVTGYYLLAQDVWRLNRLRWNAETSMLKTLGAKHQSTVTKMAARYKAKVITDDGPRTCFEARRRREGKPDLVARFGGIPLKRDRRAVIRDPAPVPVATPYRELIHRLRKRRCELCEHGATVAVHHVAKLASLGQPGPGQPAWAALMARMRRKTLIVCAPCHEYIHASPVAHAA